MMKVRKFPLVGIRMFRGPDIIFWRCQRRMSLSRCSADNVMFSAENGRCMKK